MNITLWVLQVLLAVAFFAHGWLLLAPPPDIAAQMVAQLPRAFWVFLGMAVISVTIWHLVRAEYSEAAITTLLLAMATFTAYARWRIAPIRPR